MSIRAGTLLSDRYELTERIAVGGMGEVWRARDRRLGRVVAAKVLREDLAGDEASLARLRAEARNSAGVFHPNVALLLDYGERDGSGFLVMEYVEGEPLSALLSREPSLPAARLLPILIQCARALHAAHEVGVVHRDVKPSNILLTADGGVKLTDFGISLGVDQPALTAAGMVMGTAQYLPPELALGRPATPAGDIYALGVVAYECLAGRRPYTGTNQVDIAFAHVKEPLPPLPDDVPTPVVELVTQMLAKEPAARPSSAAELARRGEEVLTELTATPTPPTSAPRVQIPTPASSTSGTTQHRVQQYLYSRRGRGATSPRSPEVVWRWPTWAELAADRRWLTTVVIGLSLAAVLAVALGTLALGAASADTAAGLPTDRLTVRNH